MKQQNLDFEVARDFFVEMKCYTIQNYLKNMTAFCDFRYRSCSQDIIYDHKITQHMHSVMLLCFLKKAFVVSLFYC